MNSAHEIRPPFQVVLRYCRSFFFMFLAAVLPCLLFCYLEVPELSPYHALFIAGNIISQVMMVAGSIRHLHAMQWAGLGLCILTAEWIANLSQISSTFESMRSLFFTLSVVSVAPAILYVILCRWNPNKGGSVTRHNDDGQARNQAV
ncbi:MAG: hypothetical protein ACAI35_18965 [Candidatus Methylacidiphilales bacterium]